MMQAQAFAVQDQTTSGIDPVTLFNWVWALDYQFRFHYGYSPWVERGYAPPASAHLLPRGAAVPLDMIPLYLKDNTDVPGALGLHEEGFASKVGASGVHSMRALDGEGKPYGEIFVQTCIQDNVPPSEVLSHEGLETVVDPHVGRNATIRKVLDTENKEFYIVEVGDPVQGNGYDIGAPEGRHCGVIVADFANPGWWKLAQSRPELSFRNSVHQPFEVGPLGYMSVAPENEPENWTQIYGEKAPHIPNPQ